MIHSVVNSRIKVEPHEDGVCLSVSHGPCQCKFVFTLEVAEHFADIVTRTVRQIEERRMRGNDVPPDL